MDLVKLDSALGEKKYYLTKYRNVNQINVWKIYHRMNLFYVILISLILVLLQSF